MLRNRGVAIPVNLILPVGAIFEYRMSMPRVSSAIATNAKNQGYDKSRYLFSPIADFLGLGGGSLIAFVLILLFFNNEKFLPAITIGSLYLANVINHPHFAHSYQIFYRDFARKLSDNTYPSELRARYWFSGVLAPIGLAIFLLSAFLLGNPGALGLGATLMLFLVGWHYVKQGYGMAMVDAVLKKRFFDEREKKALMLNAYATWSCAWCYINWTISERSMLGLDVYVISPPIFVLYATAIFAILTLLWLVFVIAHGTIVNARRYPVNGLIAYAISLYPWMFFRDVNPLYFALVPAFHSLQYMMVVWRYELNANAKSDRSKSPVFSILRFYSIALALGALGFWVAPILLQDAVPYDKTIFGSTVFLFIFWIFINVHHYLMDNVMWRKGNPDVAKYLFSSPPTKDS